MAFTMNLSNGTDTIVVIKDCSAAGYHYQDGSYTPGINSRNQSGFGDTFLPVEDSFMVAVKGTDANDVLEKIETLVTLMDSVQLWFDSDAAAADAVGFIYKPAASTSLAEQQALVVGNARVDYPRNIEKIDGWLQIIDVRISFLRGVWLDRGTDAVSSAIIQPAVLQATFGSAADIASPVDISIGYTQQNIETFFTRILTIVSSEEIFKFEAENGALTGAAAAIIRQRASGSSVVRHTPNGGSVATSSVKFSPAASAWGAYRGITIWGTVYQNSSDIDYQIETTVRIENTKSTSKIIILPNSYPQIVNFGTFYIERLSASSINKITFDITSSAGSGNLDFDMFCVSSTPQDGDGYFDMSWNPVSGVSFDVSKSSGNVLTRPSGRVSVVDTVGVESEVTFTGTTRQKTTGTDVYAIVLAVQDLGVSGWRLWDIIAGTSTTHTLTATRRLASLTPK